MARREPRGDRELQPAYRARRNLRRGMAQLVVRQFDLYRNPSPRGRDRVPYVVVLQSDLVEGSATVVVAPLLSADLMQPASKLNPRVNIEGTILAISVGEL